MTRRDIYVETRIRGDLEELWERTQNPALHERWDLRFTRIEYLPRPDEREPQRFRYATRIGFGLEIAGEGETVGARETSTGQRASALKFRSDDPKSLIREGSGYWKYVPTDDGVRFFTGYDYRVRWGALGRLFDGLVFRPLMGWATAWSFDRLRLWIERGTDPVSALRRFLASRLARVGVAFAWIWHGLVPKILFRHPDEVLMLEDAGFPAEIQWPLALTAGGVEIVLGVCVLAFPRSRWPLMTTIVLMTVALAGVASTSPRYLTAAFNPVTLNVLLVVLSAVGLAAGGEDVPTASRCLRRPPNSTGERSEGTS